MPLDLDLQELRRRVAVSPGDAGAVFDLASGLERCGARADAVEATYRARALGAEATACRALLARLGAKASPWTHFASDSERTYSAPVRGPRAGKIVATHSSESIRDVIVDADGSILGVTPGRIWQLSAMNLRVVQRWAFGGARLWPMLAPSERIVVHAHDEPMSQSARSPRTSWPHRIHASTKDRGPRFDEVTTAGFHVTSVAVTANGNVLASTFVDGARTLVLDREFVVERTLPGDLPLLHPITVDRWASSSASPELRGNVYQVDLAMGSGTTTFLGGTANVACFGPTDLIAYTVDSVEGGRRSIHAIDSRGQVRWTCPIHSLPAVGHRIASVPDGSILALGSGARARLGRIAPDGRLAWIHKFAIDGDGGVVLDREGCAYVVGTPVPGRYGLIAIAPDGAVLFTLPDIRRVLAIDSLGRLIALRGRELVAID